MNAYVQIYFIVSPIYATVIAATCLIYDINKRNQLTPKTYLSAFTFVYMYGVSTATLFKFLGIQRGYYGSGHLIYTILLFGMYTMRTLHRKQKKKNTVKTDNDTLDDTNRNWLIKEEAEAFVGNNADYYLGVWKLYYYTFFKGGNAAAIFLGISWMAYRKMYLSAVLLSIVQIVSFQVIRMYNFDAAIVLLYAIHALIGYLGNAIYRKKALRLLKKTINLDNTERRLALSEKGGVNTFAFVICFTVNLASVVSGIVLHLGGLMPV